MPAQPHDAPKQPARIQAAIGQDNDKEAPRHGRPHLTQHAQPLPPPAVFLASGQHRPRHGNGTAPIEHADDQDDKALAQGRRIHGQSQLLPLPPAHHPPQQRRKAGLDLELLAGLATFGRGFVTEFPQLLAHGIGFALQPPGQKGADGTNRTRTGQHHPYTPQRQHRYLGLAQMGEVSGDDLGPLVDCSLARHRLPPDCWSVWQYPSMPRRGPVLPSPVLELALHSSRSTPLRLVLGMSGKLVMRSRMMGRSTTSTEVPLPTWSGVRV